MQIAKDLAAAQLKAAQAANWTPAQIKALKEYNATIVNTVAKVQSLKTAHKKVAAEAKRAEAEAARELARANADIAQSQQALDEQNTELQDKLAGLSAQQIEYNRGVRDAVQSYQEWLRQGVPVAQAMQALQGRYDQLNERLQLKNQLDQAEINNTPEKVHSYTVQTSAAERYYQVIEQGAKSAADAIGNYLVQNVRSLGDLWAGLVESSKQVVAQIISTWLQLRVLQPLLGSIFGFSVGGGGGGWGSIASSAASLLSDTSSGGAASGGAAGGTSYSGYLSNLSTARNAYNWLFGGGSATTTSLAGAGASYTGTGSLSLGTYGGQGAAGFNSLTGSGTYLGPGSTSLGAYGGNVTYAPWGGTYGIGGYSAPVASYGGALLGAWYGAHQGGGGFSTVASTAAYGALGAGVAGTAAGVAGGASLGTAAGGAFGAAAGASWIPVVGWALAAAAAIDAISGGKLFGTKYQATGSTTALNIGPNGASADATLTEKKQSALFGGAKWRNKVIDPGDAARQAANELYNNIAKSMVDGATKLGIDVPQMITAQLDTVSHIHKGKVTSTEYLVNYLGQTWHEATADAAAKRIGAEALVATVAKSAGAVAETIAQQWRGSADTLLDGAQTMLAAQADINKGNSLLALGSSATLSQVIGFVQSMQQQGEKLADTYARLQQASAQYLQFVGQFQPTSNAFGSALEAINQQMQANINQANALAQAAGLQHAREQDLANIHQQAAQQAAAAIAQLSSAAQDLAAKLYGATTNTLASVNAQIDALNGKVKTATELAIGDNSPLNAKQKLDLALKGLRSGVTSADEVLGLGRKLYSSSSDYTGLYNKVQEILGLPSASGTGAGSVDAALTDYNKLIAQRDQYQAQAGATARFGDAKTLAQYVADISTTHGISYGAAASGLGFSLQDLAKDLGVTNLAAYLDQLKLNDLPGTTMTASASIVDAIHQLGRDLIQTITGGPLTNAGPVTTTGGGAVTAEQLALLEQINQRLGAIEGHTGSTANTNKQMAVADTRSALRSFAAEAR